MTDRQADRERVARERAQRLWDLLSGVGTLIGPLKDLPVEAIMEHDASTEAAVLEEVVKEGGRRIDADDWSLSGFVSWIRQQAKERRP